MVWTVKALKNNEMMCKGNAHAVYYWLRGNQSMIQTGHQPDIGVYVNSPSGACVYLGDVGKFSLKFCPELQKQVKNKPPTQQWKKFLYGDGEDAVQRGKII